MLEKVITSAVVVIIGGAGLYVGYEHVKDLGRAEVQAEWNADKERQDKAAKVAIAKREAENIQVAAAQAETVKLIKKGEANEKTRSDAINAAALSSMRSDPRSQGRGLTGTTKAEDPSESDKNTTGAWLLSNAGLQDLFARLRYADEIVAGCRAQQTFLYDNDLIERNHDGMDQPAR
jgi:hypothetical protein